MTSLARVLLAIGLLAVVGAAPQLSPSHPLSDTHDTDTPQEETLAIEHGFAESEGTDEGSEAVHDVEEETETVPQEALATQNEENLDELTPTTTEDSHTSYSGYSFGLEDHHPSDSVGFGDHHPSDSVGFGDHHPSDSDDGLGDHYPSNSHTFTQDGAAVPSFAHHPGRLSDGPTFGSGRPTNYYAYKPDHA